MTTPHETDTERKEITTWGAPTTLIDSQWGRITYAEWCTKESARMRQAGGSAVVATAKDGLVCISRP